MKLACSNPLRPLFDVLDVRAPPTHRVITLAKFAKRSVFQQFKSANLWSEFTRPPKPQNSRHASGGQDCGPELQLLETAATTTVRLSTVPDRT